MSVDDAIEECELLTDLDIVNDMIMRNNNSAEVDDADENDEDDKESEPMPLPSTGEALCAVQLLQHYLRGAAESETAQEHLQCIESFIAKSLNCRRVQTSITDYFIT